MSKVSLKSILATLNTASAAMQEQAQKSIEALTEETSAEQRKRTQRAAQNLAKVNEAQKTSTTHDEETRKLIELLARNDVASFVREHGIDANAFLQHAKYGKAKLNSILDEVARGIVPDPMKNATNAVCIMELWKKSGANAFNVLTVQRFLQHAGDTQAGYIFRFWKEFANARVIGSKNDRVLKLDESNPLTIAIAKLYGIGLDEAQREARANQVAEREAQRERNSERAKQSSRAKREEAAANALAQTNAASV